MSTLSALLPNEPRPSGVRAFSGIGNSPFRPFGGFGGAAGQLLGLVDELSCRKDSVLVRRARRGTGKWNGSSRSSDQTFLQESSCDRHRAIDSAALEINLTGGSAMTGTQ